MERYKKRLDRWNNNHIDPIWLNKVFLRKILTKKIFSYFQVYSIWLWLWKSCLKVLEIRFYTLIDVAHFINILVQHFLNFPKKFWRAAKNVFFSEDLVIFMLTWHQGVHLMKLDRVENEINVSFYSPYMATKIHC